MAVFQANLIHKVGEKTIQVGGKTIVKLMRNRFANKIRRNKEHKR
jgi:hypothetical protein